MNPNKLQILFEGAKSDFGQGLKPLPSTFNIQSRLMRDVDQRAIESAKHICVRAGQQIERNYLGL